MCIRLWYHHLIQSLICLIRVESLRLRQWSQCYGLLNVYTFIVSLSNSKSDLSNPSRIIKTEAMEPVWWLIKCVYIYGIII